MENFGAILKRFWRRQKKFWQPCRAMMARESPGRWNKLRNSLEENSLGNSRVVSRAQLKSSWGRLGILWSRHKASYSRFGVPLKAFWRLLTSSWKPCWPKITPDRPTKPEALKNTTEFKVLWPAYSSLQSRFRTSRQRPYMISPRLNLWSYVQNHKLP